MPLDARIPLMGQQLKIPDPVDQYGRQLQMQNAVLQNRKMQSDYESDQLLKDALQKSGGDSESVFKAMLPHAPMKAMAYKVAQGKIDSSRATQIKAELETSLKKAAELRNIIASATDPASYQIARARVGQLLGPEILQQIPVEYPGQEAINAFGGENSKLIDKLKLRYDAIAAFEKDNRKYQEELVKYNQDRSEKGARIGPPPPPPMGVDDRIALATGTQPRAGGAPAPAGGQGQPRSSGSLSPYSAGTAATTGDLSGDLQRTYEQRVGELAQATASGNAQDIAVMNGDIAEIRAQAKSRGIALREPTPGSQNVAAGGQAPPRVQLDPSQERLLEVKAREKEIARQAKVKADKPAATMALGQLRRSQAIVTKKVKQALKLIKDRSLPVTGPIGESRREGAGRLTGNDAFNLDRVLATIKSAIGLGKMMELKQASSSGATGFGQLNKAELDLLLASVAALDQGQGDVFGEPTQLIEHLTDIEKYLNNAVKAMESGYNAAYKKTGQGATPISGEDGWKDL